MVGGEKQVLELKNMRKENGLMRVVEASAHLEPRLEQLDGTLWDKLV